MPIPPIEPYPMPLSPATSVAGWRPDPDRAALLVHDMQNYFLDFFPTDASPLVPLLANVAALRDAAHAAGVPVFYSAQPGGMSVADRGLLLDMWGPGMGTDPYERAICAEVAPGPDDTVVTKSRYSAFHRTELRARLAAAGRDQLIVCGVYAHVGCLMTTADAFAHDLEAFLVVDAIADFTAQGHQLAIDYAAQRCAVTSTTRDVVGRLAGYGTRSGQARRASSSRVATPSFR